MDEKQATFHNYSCGIFHVVCFFIVYDLHAVVLLFVTFRLRVQTIMGPSGWIWEAIAGDDGGVARGRFFRDARKRGVGAVHIEKSKSLRVASSPLKIVHQGPGCIASQIDSIQNMG